MKNPLLALKQKEHQHAFYAVAIFIMLSILFFLLVSLKTPTENEEEVEPIETNVEISFEAPSASGSENASTYNPTPVEAQDVAVQNESSISVEKTAAPQVDKAFNFSPTDGKSDGPTFGDNTEWNIVDVGPFETGSLSRAIIKKPNFESNLQEEGEIALKLWVKALLDPNQSNSGSQYLIHEAQKAAKTMRYFTNVNVPSEYVGTKIFSFKKS
tara:strand:+ start:57635 stop:58273 length:639 start_codon:yes stop_codon:yes gene_type:complete